MPRATPLARLPGAVLFGDARRNFLTDTAAELALWGEREAVAFLDSRDSALVFARVALTVANTAGRGISPVRLAGNVKDGPDGLEGFGPGAVVVVIEQDSGVSLLEVLQAAREQPGAFPIDVACALALRLLRFSRHVPHVDDLSFSWAGRLQASPFPRLHRREVGRFFSDEEVRVGRQTSASLVPRVGAVLYELLTGASPLSGDVFAGSFIATLAAIASPERIAIGRRRAGLPRALEDLIDQMVTPADPAIDRDSVRHELSEWAADDDDAATFVASFLSSSFAARQAEDRQDWEQARLCDATAAPVWNFTPVDPVDDVAAALAELHNRDARTD